MLQGYGNDGVDELLDIVTALLQIDTCTRQQSEDA
jgi:hypothetical protein